MRETITNIKPIYSFMLGSLVTLIIVACVPNDAASQGQGYAAYKKLLDATPVLLDDGTAEVTKAVMARSLLAFLERDVEASVAELSQEYSWNKITSDGAVEMANGLDVTYQMTKNLYESDFFDQYLGLESTPIAVIGNLGVQYEVERFLKEDGSTHVMKTLAIYEIEDGKLWRLWAFPPFLGDPLAAAASASPR